MPKPAPIALLKLNSYSQPALRKNIFQLLDAAEIKIQPGMKVLVKPNLLAGHRLACTNPQVVASACAWLKARGASIVVSDSPAFGTAVSVATTIGLSEALKPLGLAPRNFGKKVLLNLALSDGTNVVIDVAAEALECDLLLSLPRVKAHSQMRITLTVKNCFGCISGIRKALYHVRFGQSADYFADCIAALWAALPPVVGLCDGIVAMSKTGPRNGEPFELGLLGASASAPALDAAIMAILGIPKKDIPLAQALARRGVQSQHGPWPLERPENFAITGFEVPAKLKDISFSPLVLARSIAKRLWLAAK